MDETVTIALAGICGYGSFYVRHILDEGGARNVRLVAAVARRPERCPRLDEIKAAGAEIYHDLEEFYNAGNADLVIISSPIQLHCPYTCMALENNSNVLCEKPLSGSVQDGLEMAESEKNSEGFVGIGYQASFSDAVQALKRDILAGDFGRPLRLKTLREAPRKTSYYARNDWAGKMRSEDGAWILDSPVNNANAHFLHNMFYVCGDSRETSAKPVEVRAELYRANAIENYDTAALRCRTENGTEILFYTSHAVPSDVGPVSLYEFEEGVISQMKGCGTGFTARLKNGEVREYGSPFEGGANKIWQCVDSVRTGEPVVCGIEAALSQTVCMSGAQESMPEIAEFPSDHVTTSEEEEGRSLVWVKGLQEAFMQCYARSLLPSEQGVEWACEGKTISL